MNEGSQEAAAEKLIEAEKEGAVLTGNIPKEVVDEKKELPMAQYLPGQVDEALERVSKAYESLIMEACRRKSILKTTTALQSQQMEDSMKWFRSRAIQGTVMAPPELSFPGVESSEIHGAQVVLSELLHAVGNCFHQCKSPKPHWHYSPPKVALRREVVVAGNEERPKRIVDLIASKPGQFQLVMLDHNIRLPCEVKPVLRSGKSKENESCEQILSHLGKACYDGLTFLRIGTSAVATGLTSNPACIQVHQLRLEMQTVESRATIATNPPVKLQLYQSARLPLMSPTCFDTWVTECGMSSKKDIMDLRAELYDVATTGSVPLGMRALYGVMAKRRSETLGPDYQKMFKNNKGIGKLLGHGSFGVVFEYSNKEKNNNLVIKVPRFPKSQK